METCPLILMIQWAAILMIDISWDDVKVDKYRENYLGHSLKAPVGRWQKGGAYEFQSAHNQLASIETLLQLVSTAVVEPYNSVLSTHSFRAYIMSLFYWTMVPDMQ
ncbi:multiple myeloma tumor-associated protein 2 [Tanacetum coccineum]